jgi:hypothetical protein
LRLAPPPGAEVRRTTPVEHADTVAGWNGLAIRNAGSGRSPVRRLQVIKITTSNVCSR